ncbi:MAG: porphobilinogen synthase, partial [Alphaproteobacteria bacterium]
PIFIRPPHIASEIPAMPGVQRLTLDELPATIRQAQAWGIPAVALFPVIDPRERTAEGEEAVNPQNLICQALMCARAESSQVGLIADVALDPFTSHGHDGVIRQNQVANEATLEILCAQAVVQARAGADVLAPSDMMDGRVGAIRKALDAADLTDKLILSYAAKYASAFYGPYRSALAVPAFTSGPSDKKTYQMDPANVNEAMREVAQDLSEGADMVMVKPALPYLDVIYRIVQHFAVPTMAFHVSGEYAMLQAAHSQGWLSYEQAIFESLLAIKRAGATGIYTYAVPSIVPQLR